MNLVGKLTLVTLVAATLLATSAVQAAFVAYDGFSNYGNTPGYALPPAGNAIIYDATPASSNLNLGQNPSTPGFTDPWESSSTFASTVYVKAEASQLVYQDTRGWALQTSPGQMRFSRDSTSNYSGNKVWSRDLDLDTALPEVLYASMLVQATPDIPFQWRSASTASGADDRRFGFDVSAAGELSVIGVKDGGGSLSTSVGSLAANEPHLIVMRFENNVNPSDSGHMAEGDQMQIWVDPDFGSEGTPDAILSPTANTSNWYVADNSSWTLGYFEFQADAQGGEGVIFDEFRIGPTWGSVTPFIAPEPTTVFIWSLLAGLGVGLGWWRRK